MHLDMRINGTTVLTGLIGNPVAHTVSPVLQNSFFTAMGINGVYLPLRVPAGSIGEAVKGLKTVGFAGFNVTIPYKYDIIELADEINEEVRIAGSSKHGKDHGRKALCLQYGCRWIRPFFRRADGNRI